MQALGADLLEPTGIAYGPAAKKTTRMKCV